MRSYPVLNNSTVRIITPVDGQAVNKSVTVKGKTPLLPSGWSKWLAVYAPGAQLWYPTRIESDDEEWSHKIVVGSAACGGAAFDVALFIAPPEATRFLESIGESTAKMPDVYSTPQILLERFPQQAIFNQTVYNASAKSITMIQEAPARRFQVEEASQTIRETKVGRDVVQKAPQGEKQCIELSDVGRDLKQNKSEAKNTISLRKLTAQGKIPVVVLAVVAIVLLVGKYYLLK